MCRRQPREVEISRRSHHGPQSYENFVCFSRAASFQTSHRNPRRGNCKRPEAGRPRGYNMREQGDGALRSHIASPALRRIRAILDSSLTNDERRGHRIRASAPGKPSNRPRRKIAAYPGCSRDQRHISRHCDHAHLALFFDLACRAVVSSSIPLGERIDRRYARPGGLGKS